MIKTSCAIGQSFGGRINDVYKPLLGHPAIDNSCGYGTPIYSYFDEEYVYKVLTVENPSRDGKGYTAVFTIVDNGIEVFEFTYGHCNPSVTVGQILTKGTVIGTEANNGEVYSGKVEITLEMQKAGDHRASHRHDQKRILKKVCPYDRRQQYITAPTGEAFYKDGYFYAYAFPNNGYASCVNWLLPLFNRDLFLGRSGYDVQCLQNFLKARGFFHGETTDYFGIKTQAAVKAFQKANAISPLMGYVGPATRSLINSLIQ